MNEINSTKLFKLMYYIYINKRKFWDNPNKLISTCFCKTFAHKFIVNHSEYSRIFRTVPYLWSTVERQLSGRRLYVLSNYPDQSDVLLCFFPGIFRIFSCKNLSFYANSLKEVEKVILFLFKKLKKIIQIF